MKKRFGQATLLGAIALIGSTHALAAKPAASDNPWNLSVVRFHPGTSIADMRAAVLGAGGQIISEIPRLHAVTALPGTGDLRASLAANPKVRAVWKDRISVRIPREDAAGDGGITGNNFPKLGNPKAGTPPDPFHNLSSFLGETNPEGILQWDDNRMNVPAAWSTTTGIHDVRVAVLDTGVQGSHKEILPNYDNQASANTIPCSLLAKDPGPAGRMDCSSEDTDGHGTWVASRIAGAANGFGSNGVAPNVTIIGMKVLSTTLGGGLTSWIVDGMVRACDANASLINMSLGGYDNPNSPADVEDYLLWVDAVDYCRSKGTAIFASAGNEHVRVNRVNMTLGGRNLSGVGQVDEGNEGYSTVIPGDALADSDLRGLLEVPAGVPGVVMVSSTNNANGQPPYALTVSEKPQIGARDQLAYYSSYGSRVDIAAPGGARKLGIPRYDGGPADILYGGWGSLGGIDPSGDLCKTAGSLATFACFKVDGAGFAWLQGTSMSSPNATGVAALTLAAHPELRGNPDALLARLTLTARKDMTNLLGANDPTNVEASFAGVACDTGFCHIDFDSAIPFNSAYGAGIVNAGAAVAP